MCSRLSTLALPARRFEIVAGARSQFLLILNRIHANSGLSDKQESQDASKNGKRKRDSENGSARYFIELEYF